MSTDRNVTVIFSGINPMATSTGIERYNIKDMKIGDRIKAYCVPVGGGDNKSDPYITLDINDALDHIEKFYGKKFGTTITVTCDGSSNYAKTKTYDEGATTYQAAMGFYAYKVDKGLLMANIFCGNTTLRILNRQNLYSGDGWRLLGPRELSKYILSDLNGTINPKKNPWGIPVSNGVGNYSFYQMPHSDTHCFYCDSALSAIQYATIYGGFDYRTCSIGWSNIDQTNLMAYYNPSVNRNSVAGGPLTSLFLYQYVESENATNIYY